MYWGSKGRHKLSTEQVQEIVERVLIDKEDRDDVATEFGVSESLVQQLCYGGARKAETAEIRSLAKRRKK